MLALAATVIVTLPMRETRCALVTEEAPYAMVSLQLAPSVDVATKIFERWRTSTGDSECGSAAGNSALDAARENLKLDEKLIVGYSATLALLALAVLGAACPSWWLPGAIATIAIAAGACDWVENSYTARLLAAVDQTPAPLAEALRSPLGWQRAFAQAKFVLLLAVVLPIVTVSLALIRRRWVGQPERRADKTRFAQLVAAETADIVGASGRIPGDRASIVRGPADEPWVDACQLDLVGVALSGGGIRSATFNLGFLAGLNKLRLLKRIDYLSTVSGGGYVGSFWSAWLAQQPKSDPGSVVEPALWPWHKPVEAGPVRHLREFSRFLATRWGFFEAETWEAVVAVFAGVTLSLLTALSLVGLGLIAWLATNFFLACPDPWAGVATVGVLTALAALAYHRGWSAPSPMDRNDASAAYRVKVAVTVVAAAVAMVVHGIWFHPLPHRVHTWLEHPWDERSLTRSYADWWPLTGIELAGTDLWFWSPRLFDLALVWLVTAGCLLLLRVAFVVFAKKEGRDRVWVPAYDRVLMQLLGSAIAWAALTTLWHVSINFEALAGKATMLGASLLSGLSFAALRNWIGVSLRPGAQASALDRVKPYLPQVLAYLTVALMVASTGSVLVAVNGQDWFSWYLTGALMSAPIVLVLVLDPAEMGLHSFYRDRIVRAYSGASNPLSAGKAERNRHTSRRDKDDVPLAALPARPLHLVCCAANDLSGDPIATLGRGARSATLSRHGVAVGGRCAAPCDLTLGAAVTASAAAFNSNMGSVSMSVGPVVSFLMAALNLRLGLWVPNPRRPKDAPQRLLPGVLFFREMLALTIADQRSREIHLSDGGHFDNLALYELVRRHCRYVIVSDCGADPSVAFDDFGNAARRIREDFGVDIDIDLRPLRPDADRRSRQHAVVGEIHYSKFDKGILVYVKPTLTGDEPPDVLQHATRNQNFPHEPTTDQFYDEAQWESYRKLGEHTAQQVFAFVDRHPGTVTPTADWIFTTARQDWYPTPPDLPQRALEMTNRFSLARNDLQREGVEILLREVFPELRELAPQRTRLRRAAAAWPRSLRAPERWRRPPWRAADHEQVAVLSCLVNVMQLMEDVWISCQLDSFWNHPLNLAWINYFARWAAAPTFRQWWPLLRPMYSVQFQRFMQEHFPVLDVRLDQTGKVVVHERIPDGLTARSWTDCHGAPPPTQRRLGRRQLVCEYRMDLAPPAADPTLQVGLVLMTLDGDRAWWSSDDFFVPASLWGAGIGGEFLRALIDCAAVGRPFGNHLMRFQVNGGIKHLDVYVKAPVDRNDPNSWSDRVSYVEFYKQQGFRMMGEEPELPDGTVCRVAHLHFDEQKLRRRRAALT